MLDDIVHQNGQQLRHAIDPGRIGAIAGIGVHGLMGLAGMVYPLSRYRIYDVQDAQFMCSRGLLEVSVDLLDDDRFRLSRAQK